jgi:hypothetical protein
MVERHPLFDEVDEALTQFATRDPVDLAGNWLLAERRPHVRGGQSSGPFSDVVDRRWNGSLSCAEPIAGIAFLATPAEIFWAKSLPALSSLSVSIAFHAYADYRPNLATFTASLGGAMLPGVPVAREPDASDDHIPASTPMETGRVQVLAEVDRAAFAVLLIQKRFLMVGRHRLWRLREKHAAGLPPRVHQMLTRRRNGSFR